MILEHSPLPQGWVFHVFTYFEIRGDTVIFVSAPRTQIFMQEYREGVRNEHYNVQHHPPPRLRPL